jgi:hypothetical protein
MSHPLREHLAAVEHTRWANWQRYLHSLCLPGDSGALIIPAPLVRRWERQIATPYRDLTEKEKDSDREQVDEYWPIVLELVATAEALKEAAWDPRLGVVDGTVVTGAYPALRRLVDSYARAKRTVGDYLGW